MVRKFGPFDTSQFYEVENRRMQRAFNPQTGFVKTGQGAVTAGTGAQLVIAAYPDGALIDGLYVENPATETVTLTTNSGSTNPRIDRLVLRLDMTAHTIAPFQIVGTPGASPTAPPLVNTGTVVDLPLCRYTMPGNASAQNPGSIIDERIYISAFPTPRLVTLGINTSWTAVSGQPPKCLVSPDGRVQFHGQVSNVLQFALTNGVSPLYVPLGVPLPGADAIYDIPVVTNGSGNAIARVQLQAAGGLIINGCLAGPNVIPPGSIFVLDNIAYNSNYA